MKKRTTGGAGRLFSRADAFETWSVTNSPALTNHVTPCFIDKLIWRSTPRYKHRPRQPDDGRVGCIIDYLRCVGGTQRGHESLRRAGREYDLRDIEGAFTDVSEEIADRAAAPFPICRAVFAPVANQRDRESGMERFLGAGRSPPTLLRGRLTDYARRNRAWRWLRSSSARRRPEGAPSSAKNDLKFFDQLRRFHQDAPRRKR